MIPKHVQIMLLLMHILLRKINIMKETNNNPLELENKLYTVEEFGNAVRNKFGADNNVSDIMLGEIILAKYPVYSCKIKKAKNHISQKSCGCC